MPLYLSFFPCGQELLDRYRDGEHIGVIAANNQQRPQPSFQLTSNYFSIYSHCWGWAIWRRAWRHYATALNGADRLGEGAALQAGPVAQHRQLVVEQAPAQRQPDYPFTGGSVLAPRSLWGPGEPVLAGALAIGNPGRRRRRRRRRQRGWRLLLVRVLLAVAVLLAGLIGLQLPRDFMLLYGLAPLLLLAALLPALVMVVLRGFGMAARAHRRDWPLTLAWA